MRNFRDNDGPIMRLAKWMVPAVIWGAVVLMVVAGVMIWIFEG